MNDRIVYKSDTYEVAAKTLSEVQNALSSVSSGLARLDTSYDWWGKIKVRAPFGMGSAQIILKQIVSSAQKADDRLGELISAVRRANALFEEAERSLGTAVTSDASDRSSRGSNGERVFSPSPGDIPIRLAGQKSAAEEAFKNATSLQGGLNHASIGYRLRGEMEKIRQRKASSYLKIQQTSAKGIYEVQGLLPRSYPYVDVPMDGMYITQESGYPDAFLSVTKDASGAMVFSISFEGSKEGEEDWLDVNFETYPNDDGVHDGFATGAKTYLNKVLSSDMKISYEVNGQRQTMTLDEVTRYIGQNKDSKLVLTGHSLGGAYAQTMAYYIIKDGYKGISGDQISVRTYASPVPFSREAIAGNQYRGLDVINVINSKDLAPKVGVTPTGDRVGETIDKILDARHPADPVIVGGMSENTSNLGKNIYFVDEDKHHRGPGGEHALEDSYGHFARSSSQNEYKGTQKVFDTDTLFQR